MTVFLPMMMAAALMVGAPPQATAPQAPGPAPNFDMTVSVNRGARLTVSNDAGEIVMRTWERNSVRVMARHASRNKPTVKSDENAVFVGGSSMGATDFDITVPSWMSVKISGHYNYIELNGLGGEINVENVRGDIEIKGGRGFVTASSIEGKINISGTQGKVTATTVNDHLVVENVTGDVVADTTNGNITLNGIRANSVEASSVNGTMIFSGPLADKGRYSFVTHNGAIRLAVQPNPDATFYVRTYAGSFSHPGVNLKAQGQPREGRRNTFVGGNGSAQVELESFNGGVRVMAAGGQ